MQKKFNVLFAFTVSIFMVFSGVAFSAQAPFPLEGSIAAAADVSRITTTTVSKIPTVEREKIGIVLLSKGDKNYRVDAGTGEKELLKIKTPIYEGDRILTGAKAYVQMVLMDGALFKLTGVSDFLFKDYSWDKKTGKGVNEIYFAEGTTNFYAGKIAKTGEVNIETATGTIGIRGTSGTTQTGLQNGVPYTTVTAFSDVNGDVSHIFFVPVAVFFGPEGYIVPGGGPIPPVVGPPGAFPIPENAFVISSDMATPTLHLVGGAPPVYMASVLDFNAELQTEMGWTPMQVEFVDVEAGNVLMNVVNTEGFEVDNNTLGSVSTTSLIPLSVDAEHVEGQGRDDMDSTPGDEHVEGQGREDMDFAPGDEHVEGQGRDDMDFAPGDEPHHLPGLSDKPHVAPDGESRFFPFVPGDDAPVAFPVGDAPMMPPGRGDFDFGGGDFGFGSVGDTHMIPPGGGDFDFGGGDFGFPEGGFDLGFPTAAFDPVFSDMKTFFSSGEYQPEDFQYVSDMPIFNVTDIYAGVEDIVAQTLYEGHSLAVIAKTDVFSALNESTTQYFIGGSLAVGLPFSGANEGVGTVKYVNVKDGASTTPLYTLQVVDGEFSTAIATALIQHAPYHTQFGADSNASLGSTDIFHTGLSLTDGQLNQTKAALLGTETGGLLFRNAFFADNALASPISLHEYLGLTLSATSVEETRILVGTLQKTSDTLGKIVELPPSFFAGQRTVFDENDGVAMEIFYGGTLAPTADVSTLYSTNTTSTVSSTSSVPRLLFYTADLNTLAGEYTYNIDADLISGVLTDFSSGTITAESLGLNQTKFGELSTSLNDLIRGGTNYSGSLTELNGIPFAIGGNPVNLMRQRAVALIDTLNNRVLGTTLLGHGYEASYSELFGVSYYAEVDNSGKLISDITYYIPAGHDFTIASGQFLSDMGLATASQIADTFSNNTLEKSILTTYFREYGTSFPGILSPFITTSGSDPDNTVQYMGQHRYYSSTGTEYTLPEGLVVAGDVSFATPTSLLANDAAKLGHTLNATFFDSAEASQTTYKSGSNVHAVSESYTGFLALSEITINSTGIVDTDLLNISDLGILANFSEFQTTIGSTSLAPNSAAGSYTYLSDDFSSTSIAIGASISSSSVTGHSVAYDSGTLFAALHAGDSASYSMVQGSSFLMTQDPPYFNGDEFTTFYRSSTDNLLATKSVIHGVVNMFGQGSSSILVNPASNSHFVAGIPYKPSTFSTSSLAGRIYKGANYLNYYLELDPSTISTNSLTIPSSVLLSDSGHATFHFYDTSAFDAITFHANLGLFTITQGGSVVQSSEGGRVDYSASSYSVVTAFGRNYKSFTDSEGLLSGYFIGDSDITDSTDAEGIIFNYTDGDASASVVSSSTTFLSGTVAIPFIEHTNSVGFAAYQTPSTTTTSFKMAGFWAGVEVTSTGTNLFSLDTTNSSLTIGLSVVSTSPRMLDAAQSAVYGHNSLTTLIPSTNSSENIFISKDAFFSAIEIAGSSFVPVNGHTGWTDLSVVISAVDTNTNSFIVGLPGLDQYDHISWGLWNVRDWSGFSASDLASGIFDIDEEHASAYFAMTDVATFDLIPDFSSMAFHFAGVTEYSYRGEAIGTIYSTGITPFIQSGSAHLIIHMKNTADKMVTGSVNLGAHEIQMAGGILTDSAGNLKAQFSGTTTLNNAGSGQFQGAFTGTVNSVGTTFQPNEAAGVFNAQNTTHSATGAFGVEISSSSN
ncbi:FecR domain-containing protein [Simkania negevensis]|uniref:FecR domain-containing protein n=1 Tax=Simkania negevensis TaxID=83561 RepID=A0ABS3ASD3_9BACT|nr:FecR domain-containing protein [Simkania negevensis]